MAASHWSESTRIYYLNRLLRYIIGDELERLTEALVNENCNGCIIDHPSQLQRTCLELNEMQYDIFYEQAISSIDLGFIEAVFNESAHTACRGGVATNSFDFERFAAETLTIWANTAFRNGKDLHDGPSLIRSFRRIFPGETIPEDGFIMKAREKVKLLKQRMTYSSSRD